MPHVLACITQEHDIRLVALAGSICLLACLAAFNLFGRGRSATAPRDRRIWIVAAAMVAGGGVWATHFVAMLAYRPGLPVHYDFTLTLFSVAISVAVIWFGCTIGLRRRSAIIGGAVAGTGIGAMHYVGMSAMHIAAKIHHDPAAVFLSVVIGIVLGALAFWLHDHRSGLTGTLSAALLLAMAICALHFTAMSGITLAPYPVADIPDTLIAPEWLAVSISAIVLLIIALSLVGSFVDQHLAERKAEEAERLHEHIIELEVTKQNLIEALAGSHAKSEFLANMSHELRTPLNAIIGFSEVLSAEILGPVANKQQLEYIKDIHSSGLLLLSIINDVLDLSKIEAGKLELISERVSLYETIVDTVRLVRERAHNRGLTLATTMSDSDISLWADQRAIRQVLLNVLSNAIKFSHPGGTIYVRGSVADRLVVVEVEDRGIGMTEAEMERAVQPFGQASPVTTRTHGGTGLGLPIALNLVNAHGGTLTIESSPGRGTIVRIALPRHAGVPVLANSMPVRLPHKQQVRSAA